jgi:hypothetical protein
VRSPALYRLTQHNRFIILEMMGQSHALFHFCQTLFGGDDDLLFGLAETKIGAEKPLNIMIHTRTPLHKSTCLQ